MAKEFDATLKQLVDARPEDWLALAGLPVGSAVDVTDADLSTISVAADKVFRVEASQRYIAHLEFQASYDVNFDLRVLMYHVLLRSRHRLPVRSVALLLRPSASGPRVTGRVQDLTAPETKLDFAYGIIRVWEQPPELFLNGGWGTLPLALVSDVGPSELPRIVSAMSERLRREASPEVADAVWAASTILGGLRYPTNAVEQLLHGVWNMQESATYQAIMQRGFERGVSEGRVEGRMEGRVEGQNEGRAKEARNLVLLLGSEKLGAPEADVREALGRITDVDRLEELARRILRANDWRGVMED